MLLVLFLGLGASTVVLLDAQDGREVPKAFLDSQQEIAESTARSIGATANQSLSDLRTLDVSAGAEPMLEALVRNRKWRGAAVLDGGRTLLATRGEPVPVQAIPAGISAATVTSTIAANGELVLIATTPLPNGQLLAATTAVRLPDADPDESLRQSFLLTTLAGKVVGVSGSVVDPAVEALAGDAGRAASAGQPGTMLGTAGQENQPTLAFARVAPSSSPDSVDLAVVAVANGPLAGSSGAGSGIVPAAVLAALALAGFVLVRRYVSKPVVFARADLLALAAGRLDTSVRAGRAGEVARIVAAARTCQDRLTSASSSPAPVRRITARVVSFVVAASIFGWSAWMLVAFRGTDVDIPPAVVASVRAQTAKATDALRRSMNDGVADLAAVAGSAKDDAALRTALEELLASQTRYRSLYVVDRGGAVVGSPVGRPPLRSGEIPSSGLRQQNQAGRVPVIFAEVPVAGRDTTLIGEFDLDHLRVLLKQVPGHARVVDGEFRTISATEGFLAFEPIDLDSLRKSAELARRGGVVGEVMAGSRGPAIVASSSVLGGEAGRLGWTVTTEKPGTELALPVNETRRYAQLVALVGALIALFGYGWLLFTVLGPLRRVARAADSLVDGDFKSVIYPQRHDEIGTIAFCLEISRQAVVDGPSRLGEVRRPRGAATDETQLMRPVRP